MKRELGWNEQAHLFMKKSFNDYLPDDDFAEEYYWAQLVGLLGTDWWECAKTDHKWGLEQADSRIGHAVKTEMLFYSEEHMEDLQSLFKPSYRTGMSGVARDIYQMFTETAGTKFLRAPELPGLSITKYLIKRLDRFGSDNISMHLLTNKNDIITRCFMDDLAVCGLASSRNRDDIANSAEERVKLYSSADINTPYGLAVALFGMAGIHPSLIETASALLTSDESAESKAKNKNIKNNLGLST